MNFWASSQLLCLFLSKLMLWEMVCRGNPGLPMSCVPWGTSADVPSPAPLTAREGRKVMPGTSGSCPRDVLVYWGVMQSLQRKSEEKQGAEGWLCSLSDPLVGHRAREGAVHIPSTQWDLTATLLFSRSRSSKPLPASISCSVLCR